MSSNVSGEITRLLKAWGRGEQDALDRLVSFPDMNSRCNDALFDT
jgi:hypothetical protein